jgi:hypothetical protein
MPNGSKGRSCDRKRRHESKESAERQKAQLTRDTGSAWFRMQVYRCRHCNGWHVGHTGRSKRKRW